MIIKVVTAQYIINVVYKLNFIFEISYILFLKKKSNIPALFQLN